MAAIISEFVLDEFQAGNPLQVLDLGNGLNVALVGSEDDRSRMLKVIPWTLYGPGSYFDRRKTDGEQFQPPGRVGVAVLGTDHGVFHIERDWYNRPEVPYLSDSEGRNHEPQYLGELLEGVTPKTFHEVFTFELVRMARMVRHETYGLNRLPRLTDYLREKSPQLSHATDIPQLDLRSVQTRLDELKQLVAYGVTADGQAGTTADNHEKLRRELTKLDSEIADARTKLKQLHKEMDETQYALASNRMHLRLKDISDELAESRGSKNSKSAKVNSDVAGRLDDKIAAARRELDDLKEEADDLRRQGRELGNLSRMNQLMPQIEGLLLQEKSLLKEDSAAEQIESQIRDLESRIETERMHASVRPTEFAPPKATIQETHSQARMDALIQRLNDAERDCHLAEERLGRAESSSHLAREQMARASALAAHPEEAVAIHEAEQRVAELQELLGYDDQLQRMVAERDDLQSQVRRLYARQLMPFRVAMALGVPFMIGVAMIIYGLIMYNGNPNWNLILLGFAATIATSLFKISFDQQTTGRLHSGRRQLTRLNQRIEEIGAAREQSAVSGVSLVRQLEDAQRELELLQTRFASRETQVSPFGNETSRTAGNVDTARMQLADAQRRIQELNHAWRELMIELNLSPNLGPEHARDALATRSLHVSAIPTAPTGPSVTDQLATQLQQLRQDLDRRRDWLGVIGGQARQLVGEIGTTYGGANIVEQLQILRQAYDDHRENMQTRRNLLRGLKRLKQKAQRVRETGRRYAEQRRKLDDEARWKNQQAKQRTKLNADRVRDMERQREAIKSELTEIRDRFGLDEETELTSLSDSELESRLDSLSGKASRIQDRLVKQSEQRGRCRAQLNLAHDDEETTPFAWQDILAKTQEIAEECDHLNRGNAIRPNRTERYQYLDEASGYLRELTYGQYVEIDTPEEGHITLIDRDGQAIDFREVRREHYANIYFSLWLARISAYANRGLRLPIVMEDPLEATPLERKVEVAKMLRDFAARSQLQVILVTSDPHNADVFAQLDVPIADLWSEPVMIEESYPEPKEAEFELVESTGHQPIAATNVAPVRRSNEEPLFPPIS